MNHKLAERTAPMIELVAEVEHASLPATVQPISTEQLDRTARMTPRINRQAESETIAPVVAALTQLDEAERFEAFRIGNRLAVQREKAAQFEGTLHGIKDQASLSGNWQHLGRDPRIIALELGRMGRIKRIQVWSCLGQRWCGYEWEASQRIDIEETFPADYPMTQALRSDRFVIIPGEVTRSTRCGWGVQLTTADHLLHDLGRRGIGVLRFKGFERALMAPQLRAQKRNEKSAGKSTQRRWILCTVKYGAVAAILTILVLSTI